MKTQSKKNKGRLYQQALVKIISDFFDLQEGDIVSRAMGSPGTDLMLSPKAKEVFPVSVEAKNWKKPPGHSEMEQAEYNTYKKTFPVVMWKPPRKNPSETIVYIRLDDFLKLVQCANTEEFKRVLDARRETKKDT